MSGCEWGLKQTRRAVSDEWQDGLISIWLDASLWAANRYPAHVTMLSERKCCMTEHDHCVHKSRPRASCFWSQDHGSNTCFKFIPAKLTSVHQNLIPTVPRSRGCCRYDKEHGMSHWFEETSDISHRSPETWYIPDMLFNCSSPAVQKLIAKPRTTQHKHHGDRKELLQQAVWKLDASKCCRQRESIVRCFMARKVGDSCRSSWRGLVGWRQISGMVWKQ